MMNASPTSARWKIELPTGRLGAIFENSLPKILPIASRSPEYLVLKKMLMFIADLMAESKSLI